MVSARYASIVEKFRTWAVVEPRVRAALVVGSQARSLAPADEWSDLDLVIFHESPERLIASTEWFALFGEVILTTVEPTAVLDQRERRVIYSDGRDVDFAVFPAAALALATHSTEGRAVLRRGCEVLVDKDSRLRDIGPESRDPGPPFPASLSKTEFESEVADFWYHVLWLAKKLRRGELWIAKMGCDGYLKRLLLRMIEWQTIVRNGPSADVWHEGRFLDTWVAPEVRDRLPATFARYERADVVRALYETARLYGDLAREVARNRRWEYPSKTESAVLALAASTLDSSGLPPFGGPVRRDVGSNSSTAR